MRIRKHAKLAGISLTTTTTAPAGCSSADLISQSSSRFRSPHVCQLNQSPWDVISFPPDSPSSSPFLVDGEESNYTANGSSANSLGAVESVASMKISLNAEDKNVSSYNHGIELGFRNGGTILCCKKNGKSWKCKKEASIGHAFCEHHLGHQSRDNYDSLPVLHPLAAKKSEKPATAAAAIILPTRRRGRPRKVQAPPPPPPPAVTDPYEFYYYSGFGPWRGKKRGVSRVPKPDDTDSVEEEEEEEEEIAHSSLAPPSEIDSDEFDYFEEEEEGEENDLNVKKMRRGRKPIKARSLKSLM